MKKVTLLLMLSFVLAITYAKADILEVNSAKINAQIANLSKFPDIEIVGYETNNSYGPRDARIFTNNIVNPSPMTLYVVKKQYLKQVDLLKNDWHKDKHVQKLNLYYDRNYCTTRRFASIMVEYTLAKKGNFYYVYKSRATYRTKGTKRPANRVKNFKVKVVDYRKPILISEDAL